MGFKSKSPCPPAHRHSLWAFSAARTCGSQARPFTLFQRGEQHGLGWGCDVSSTSAPSIRPL
ncbi:hypothetical protein [Lysobacter gummosus]|uniref:hypothetical protein n=1 Tax=Lysobacter gummosus TaxID=262324 RepID=UPI00363C962F